jgi:septal ring factor EnvC (AmiA/AmiB activator)
MTQTSRTSPTRSRAPAMKIDPTVIVAVIAFFGSALSIYLTNRFAARSAKSAQESAEKQKALQVDSESFKRARDNYDAALTEQENRIERLRREMEQDREEYRNETDECKRRIRGLQRDINALSEWARPLLVAARAAGIRHPNPPVWLNVSADSPEIERGS